MAEYTKVFIERDIFLKYQHYNKSKWRKQA